MVLFFKKEQTFLPWRIEHQEEAPSTQDLAIAAATAGAPNRCAYIAARQTAGRGRQDRVWQNCEGNLHVSALLRPGEIAPVPAFWSLMAGLAVHDAVSSFLTETTPTLKWPNDLMFGNAKLAGVLIDSALTAGGTLDWVVIGVGVNLAHAPAVPGRRTACLAEHGAHVTPRAMADRLMAEIDLWGAQDLATIRAAWLAACPPSRHSPCVCNKANG